ncbi:MAG: hypothetical protein JW939_01595 [Candidatus Thermoplasmatota archaeon]|nr:hypothetical protein [Candidatus Thermoplasmatota archaeon]
MMDKENENSEELQMQGGNEASDMETMSDLDTSGPKKGAIPDGPPAEGSFDAMGQPNTEDGLIGGENPPAPEKAGPEEGSEKDQVSTRVPTEKAAFSKIDNIPDPLEGMDLPSRREIVEQLVSKHSDMRMKYQKEMDELDIKPPEIIDLKEGERSIRDTINEEVQALKTRRSELREANKKLRSEFFDLLEREERLKDHRKDVEMYSNFSRDLEWKLETEAITIETERRLLDELRETLNKMRSITEGYTPDEIKARLTEIQEEIGTNLMTIEELHNALLEKVEESNVHHERYLGANKQIRERESRRGWLKRRIELHAEMETFWKTQMDQAAKLDAEESSRTLEDIRNQLIKVFQQREINDKEEQEKTDKAPDASPRKKRGRKFGGTKVGKSDTGRPTTPTGEQPGEKGPSTPGEGGDP